MSVAGNGEEGGKESGQEGGPARESGAVSVLLLCESLAVTGGVERFVCQLAGDLAARGLRVTIGSADAAGAPLAFAVAVASGVRVVQGGSAAAPSTDESPGVLRPWRLLGMRWRVGRALGALVAKERPDVIVLNGLVAACSTLLLHPAIARRSICCDHNHFCARSRLWQALRALLYPKVAAVVSLTRADAPRFAALNANTRVIANASTLRAEAPASPDAGRVLAVGRHQAQKGFDLLLAAWAEVVAAVPSARLRIVGDGPLRAGLVALAGRLGVAGSVDWTPPTPRIEPLYREAAIFVLPSRYEGMPLALLEAQALGLPAVAFDCPTGPADIVSAATGILVPAGDSSALARGIVALLVDPARRDRMGRAAIERSRAVFSRERQVESWAALIGSVAGTRRAPLRSRRPARR